MNPTDDSRTLLSQAVTRLEAYTRELETRVGSGKPHYSLATILWSYFRSLLSTHYYFRVEKEQLAREQRIQTEIRSILAHAKLIEKWKRENDPVAIKIHETIAYYNRVLHQARRPPDSLLAAIYRYIVERSGYYPSVESLNEVILPYDVYHKISDLNPHAKKIARLTSSTFQSKDISGHEIPQHVMDALRMKVSRSLADHAFNFEAIREALNWMKESPIQTLVDTGETPKEGDIVLSQQISPIPGEVFKWIGAVQKFSSPEPKSFQLLPGSFQLTHETRQTGYPYPAQHTGRALSGRLIPTPLRLEGLELEAILRRKNETARSLLPDGVYYWKARQQFKCNRQAFNERADTLLTFHHAQCLEFLKLFKSRVDLTQIDLFFRVARQEADPFTFFSQTFEKLNRVLIENPFEFVQDAWLERRFTKLHDESAHVRFEATRSLLHSTMAETIASLEGQKLEETHPSEKARLGFLLSFGLLYARFVEPILLQELSEKINFKSPILDDACRKIQALAFHELLQFLDELEKAPKLSQDEWVAQTQEKLEKRLKEDTCILRTSHFEDLNPQIVSLIEEVQTYYAFPVN